MIILDTSFLVAFYNTDDIHHMKAFVIIDQILQGKYGEAVINDYIFAECLNVFFYRLRSMEKTIHLGEILKPLLKVRGEESAIDVTWDFFKTQKGTSLSFTDCAILTSMKYEGITNIATFDKDFEKIESINVVN